MMSLSVLQLEEKFVRGFPGFIRFQGEFVFNNIIDFSSAYSSSPAKHLEYAIQSTKSAYKDLFRKGQYQSFSKSPVLLGPGSPSHSVLRTGTVRAGGNTISIEYGRNPTAR